MSSKEMRRNARSRLSIGEEHNMFFLVAGENIYEINKIRDASLSGVGLAVQRAFEPGENIALRYDSDDLELMIDGTVAWCSPGGDEGGYIMGVEFDPRNCESNSLFFLALRKYLDDFDSAYADA